MVRHDPNYEEKPPVTLEGIAAVLAVVPALIGQASQKDQQSALSDALRMLSRACVMAGGKTGETQTALADMLEPFRCTGEPDHTGALSRLLAENKGLKEYEAWVEQTVRLISTSGDIGLTVKAGNNLPEAVCVLLEDRKRLSTLLEESGFPSGFRGAHTLFARLQELVVAWRKAEEAGTQIPPSLLAENEKRFQEKVAASLRVILYPGQPAPNLDLDGLLHEADSRLNRGKPPQGNPPPYVVLADVEKKLAAALNTEPDDFEDLTRVAMHAAEDAKKWREREETATDIRDAALEEAAARFDRSAATLTAWQVRSFIRALKSKPAPKWEPDSPTDLPDEQQAPREPPPEKLRELFEHREAREEAARRLDALATSDAHDFGWALAQMRAGKKVRRPVWEHPYFYRFTGSRIEDESGVSAVVHWENILATDWEVAE